MANTISYKIFALWNSGDSTKYSGKHFFAMHILLGYFDLSKIDGMELALLTWIPIVTDMLVFTGNEKPNNNIESWILGFYVYLP